MTIEEEIRGKLKEIMDPELMVNIVDLGLIYGIKFADGLAEITMTLTTPGCPLPKVFETLIKRKLERIPKIKAVKIILVFEPLWDQSKIAPETRAALGF